MTSRSGPGCLARLLALTTVATVAACGSPPAPAGADGGAEAASIDARDDAGRADAPDDVVDVADVARDAVDVADAAPVADAARDARPDAPDDAASAVPYDSDGPVPYTMRVERVSAAGRTYNVTVFLPSTPGRHPLVSFSCGSTQTAAGYLLYARRLASHGVAMFLTDDPGLLVNTADIVPAAVHIADAWVRANFADSIDATRVGVAGHSRGGAVSLLAAENGLRGRVVAWFGLDPVDNQFLMTPRQYARTNLPRIGIPTGFLGAQVISNCAPAADGYMTLFPLAPAPKVLIVGVGAGHTQFQVASACTGCGVCSPSGTADPDVVLAYAVRYFAAFFARELLRDASVGARFEGAGAPADVAAGRITVM